MGAIVHYFNNDLRSVLLFCGKSLIKTLKIGGADVVEVGGGKWIINERKIQEFPINCECEEDPSGRIFHQHYELRFVKEFKEVDLDPMCQW